MSHELQNLVNFLKANPGYVYVNPDGTHLFALVGPEQKLMVAVVPDGFDKMTDEEINAYIQKLLS